MRSIAVTACLQGGEGRDVVDAGTGDDSVFGQNGNDRITGGLGRDEILAGGGNDTVLARDGVADTIDCGAGVDTAFVNGSDKVACNCERRRHSRRS